ncbi:MAG: serine acetyltransferase [Tannerellaceae bacterium]|jgi:serine O-acetyltransferase|nr:serine acetyltransferase [Tannerellaceae bacterium]
MDRMEISGRIGTVADTLAKADYPYLSLPKNVAPSIDDLENILCLLRAVIFPGFFDTPGHTGSVHQRLEKIFDLLNEQIRRGLSFGKDDTPDARDQASHIAMALIDKIPCIQYLLSTDVKSILIGDPAAKSVSEVIFSYPATQAILYQRVAHELLLMNVPMIPRIITEIAHSRTGIDIHPGACIGEFFGIDHGTGVVIGETAIIGNNVRLYQGVTLGAKKYTLDDNGEPLSIPRHPVIEDNVTIYSNTSVLGRITIGRDSIIGGNVWLTHDVPPRSKISQGRAVEDK